MAKNRRVLIVEDDYIQAYSIEETLKSLCYDMVGMIDNGEEAIELAEKLGPDLILMDISLAGNMNGFEAAAIINKENKIPIIFITGYPISSSRIESEEVGGTDVLIKPIERELLSDILGKYLSK